MLFVLFSCLMQVSYLHREDDGCEPCRPAAKNVPICIFSEAVTVLICHANRFQERYLLWRRRRYSPWIRFMYIEYRTYTIDVLYIGALLSSHVSPPFR